MKKENRLQLNRRTKQITRNLIPGTLIYRGGIKQGFVIDVHYYTKTDLVIRSFESTASFLEFDMVFKEKENYIRWINVTGLWNPDEINSIGTYLGISKLILEQILNISNHSINRSGTGYLFNSMQMVYSVENKIKSEYISIYKGHDFLVTFQEKPGDIFDGIRERIKANLGVVRSKSLNYLYFSLLDALGDNYMAVTEELRPGIEDIEEKVIRGEKIKIQSIHELRKILMILGFSSEPFGKFIQLLAEDEELLPMSDRSYLESLDIHMRDVISEIRLQNDSVDHLFENYVLNNSNNMNQIMTILTIFSAIFIPLSFLAGVFGMNFEYLPGLKNPMGFFYFLIGCAVTVGGMIAFFKLRKWF